MAEIGPLLLPPPAAFSGRSASPTQRSAGKGGTEEDPRGLTQVDAAADSTSGPKAKQFRFRVLDGGRGATLGNAEVPAQTNREADADASASTRTAQGTLGSGTGSRAGSSDIPAGTPVATFLAQLIAQEQLAPGLYDPPVKAADRAYRQAGAEPPLNDGASATAHFKIAV